MKKTYTTIQTTDGRYNRIEENSWWDTTDITLHPESVVNKYMADNPGVGIMTTREIVEYEDKTSRKLLWISAIIAALASAAIVVTLLPKKVVKAQVQVKYDRQFEWVFR